MFLERKNKQTPIHVFQHMDSKQNRVSGHSTHSGQAIDASFAPEASLEALRARALLLESIRQFFKQRSVLEVETPLLCHAAVQDPHLHPIPAQYQPFGNASPQTLYLQTSPEFAMKRLLAANIGPIYQLCKAFRNGEVGKIHNPEFTMLEWYRPGFNHHQLMNEMDDFLAFILNTQTAERISYQDLFLMHLDLDPFQATQLELQNKAKDKKINLDKNMPSTLTNDDWLNLLLTHSIEPKLGFERPVMVFDFPKSQAALAKIRKTPHFEVAERFEVYMNGMELANGYHELTDGNILEQRLYQDAATRKQLNHPEIPIDSHLLNALKAGLPDCAGVALGFDRLLMLKMNAKEIREVLAFTIEKA